MLIIVCDVEGIYFLKWELVDYVFGFFLVGFDVGYFLLFCVYLIEVLIIVKI